MSSGGVTEHKISESQQQKLLTSSSKATYGVVDAGVVDVVGAVNNPARRGTSADETDTPKTGAVMGSNTRTADVRPVDSGAASPVLFPIVQLRVTSAAAAGDDDDVDCNVDPRSNRPQASFAR